jgi:hypothetical protein
VVVFLNSLQKNGANLPNFELTKNRPRLNQIPTPPERCSTGFGTRLARLLHESRQAPRLNQIPTPPERCSTGFGTRLARLLPAIWHYWFWLCAGATTSWVAPRHLARLLHESRQAAWRDSCSSRTSEFPKPVLHLSRSVGIWLSLWGFFVSSKFEKFVPFLEWVQEYDHKYLHG